MTAERFKSLLVDLGWLILIILAVFCFMSMLGCASSKSIEVPDDITVEEVTTPMPCIIDIAPLPDLVLPALPPYPGEEGGEAEIKKWLADLKTVIQQRETLLAARVEAYEVKIEAHNRNGPKCSEIQ